MQSRGKQMGTSIVGATLSDQDLRSAVTQVWRAYLRRDVQDPGPAGPPPSSPVTLSAVVGITGGWRGHLRVDCGPRAAAAISARLLDRPVSDCRDKDLAEALGRFATTVAGCVVSLLPAQTSVCLPVITSGGAQYLRLPHCQETNRVLVAWEGETFQVRILQADQTSGPATELRR